MPGDNPESTVKDVTDAVFHGGPMSFGNIFKGILGGDKGGGGKSDGDIMAAINKGIAEGPFKA